MFKDLIKKMCILVMSISFVFVLCGGIAKAAQTRETEEYIVTVNGASCTYRGNTAQQIMAVNVKDSVGIVGSRASINRTIGGWGWAVVEKSNTKSPNSNLTYVKYTATVSFEHPIFDNATRTLIAEYNF